LFYLQARAKVAKAMLLQLCKLKAHDGSTWLAAAMLDARAAAGSHIHGQYTARELREHILAKDPDCSNPVTMQVVADVESFLKMQHTALDYDLV
jgi:hypothetical protein